MESPDNYGTLIRILRQKKRWSIQQTAKVLKRSPGWLCEVENGVGRCRLKPSEFDRVVDTLDGSTQRHLFKTWIAGLKNQERSSKLFDGAVLKFIRQKKGLSLAAASRILKLSKGYLSKLENGVVAISLTRRNEMMIAYGYSPSSFKNLSTDPIRSRAVTNRLKFPILLRQISTEQAEKLFEQAIRKHITAKTA